MAYGGRNNHMGWHKRRRPYKTQKETQRGKHSWLPLLLLTPAVGCNLHSNKTWQRCAELIFEVVIFNTPFLSLFFSFAAVGCRNAFCIFKLSFNNELLSQLKPWIILMKSQWPIIPIKVVPMRQKSTTAHLLFAFLNISITFAFWS